MLFHQNNKLILFPMNGKVRPWSKVLFSPLFPDSLLCNMYAKRCLAPQQLSMYHGKMLNFSQAVFRYFNPSGRERAYTPNILLKVPNNPLKKLIPST